MKKLVNRILSYAGIKIVRLEPVLARTVESSLPDFSDSERAIITQCAPYTMTSIERLAALLNAMTYVTENKIPGDIVECGVWRGGSMMLIARSLLAHGDTSRNLYLYDTFEGMPAPTNRDKSLEGLPADQLLSREPRNTGIWCYATIEDVRENLLSTGYPKDKIHLIKGKVEDTIPGVIPDKIALLRLDTDWYESTKHELHFLFPLLDPAGILIIDDYGHWQGARAAVDEYFKEQKKTVYLHRVDYTARLLVGNGTSCPSNS